MEEKIEYLKGKFGYLKIERIEEEDIYVEKGEIPEIDIHYNISNFNGNKNINLKFSTTEEIDDLIKFLEVEPIILDEYLGIKYEDKYEILISPLNFRYITYHIKKRSFEIVLNYFKNELNIKIQSDIENLPITYLNSVLGRNGGRKFVLTIENLKKNSPDGLNMDLRNILISVLFDFEYSFNIPFEAIELNSINRRLSRVKRPSLPIPKRV